MSAAVTATMARMLSLVSMGILRNNTIMLYFGNSVLRFQAIVSVLIGE